jgi:peptidoglycan/xylan/chitin deacetylase (PgdA/CDA1 family)
VGYHRVVEDFDRSAGSSIPATLISRSMLERHIDWIGRRFEFVSLDEVVMHQERNEGFRRPSAALTFDDGYQDVHDLAFPMLKAKGIPAAVFVVTALAGTARVPLYDRLYLAMTRARTAWPSSADRLAWIVADLGLSIPGLRDPFDDLGDPFRLTRILLEGTTRADLERVVEVIEMEVGVDEARMRERQPLTWDMILTMQRSGITIGSHTRTHALLTLENEQGVEQEVLGSRQELEEHLGSPIRHFAYPNGWFDDATVGAVERAGYRGAYTSCRHRHPVRPLFTMPRTLLWEKSSLGVLGDFSPAVMGCHADGTFERHRGCPLNHWN